MLCYWTAVLDQSGRDVLPSEDFFLSTPTCSSHYHPLNYPRPAGNFLPVTFTSPKSQVNPSLASILPSFQCVDHSWEEWGLLNGVTLRWVSMTRANSLHFSKDTFILKEMLFYSKGWLSNGGIWYQVASSSGTELKGVSQNKSLNSVSPNFSMISHVHQLFNRTFQVYLLYMYI